MSRIRGLELRLIALPLVRPFRTSFGEDTTKEAILLRLGQDKIDAERSIGQGLRRPNLGTDRIGRAPAKSEHAEAAGIADCGRQS